MSCLAHLTFDFFFFNLDVQVFRLYKFQRSSSLRKCFVLFFSFNLLHGQTQLKCLSVMLRLRYYEDDQEVESDNELQELVNELSANGTGDFGGMGMVRHFTKQSQLLQQKCIQLSAFLEYSIQLFREMLSEKVHRTILKGTVGGFEFTVL